MTAPTSKPVADTETRRLNVAKAHDVPYLVEELGKLGIDDIRERMSMEGITGDPMNPCSCIIAEYLGVKTGRVVTAYPLAGITWFDRSQDNGLMKVGTVYTPVSVQLFMQAFDQSLYPELIRR